MLVLVEKRILKMLANSLAEILDSLCRLVEAQAGDVLASILLVEGDRLRHGGAPSLPKAYTDAINGTVIGPTAGAWAWDPRTQKVLYCSEEMFRIFGLDPRESSPSRDNFRQRIHPEDRDWVRKRFEESLRERVDTFAEYRVLLPDGTVRHINASGHPVLNEDGELIEFVGTALDVAERKRAETELRESEQNYRMLFESIDEATQGRGRPD